MKIFEEKGWAMPKHATRWYLCMFAVVVVVVAFVVVVVVKFN